MGVTIDDARAIAATTPPFIRGARRRPGQVPRRPHRLRRLLRRHDHGLGFPSSAYREYPYVIRGRDDSDPAAERRRISTEVMAMQRELTEASIWIGAEAPNLHYEHLDAVEDDRRIAAGLMNEAWGRPATSDDAGMNIADLHDKLAPLRAHDAVLAELIRDEVSFSWNPHR